jgi:hypothetical protein
VQIRSAGRAAEKLAPDRPDGRPQDLAAQSRQSRGCVQQRTDSSSANCYGARLSTVALVNPAAQHGSAPTSLITWTERSPSWS